MRHSIKSLHDEHSTYGIEVNTLKNFTEAPDVVILVGNSYQIMRLTQGVGYHHGIKPTIDYGGYASNLF